MPRLIKEVQNQKQHRIQLTLQTKYPDIDSISPHEEGDLIMPNLRTTIDFKQPSYKRMCMIDKLQCMRNQELMSYACPDYMKKTIQSKAKMKPLTFTKSKEAENAVDASCREKIAEWCFRVVDFFNLDRETVYYAMNYIDRFISAHFVDRHTFKLVSTTALMLAIKLHQPNKVDLSSVVKNLSRRQFEKEDVVRMEHIMLRSLAWKLHPPTPPNYVLRMMALNPFTSKRLKEFDADGVKHLAIFFVELATIDYFFVTKKQSMVALAAIVNAMECLGLFHSLQQQPQQVRQTERHEQLPANNSAIVHFVQILFDTMDVDCDGLAISESRDRLWNLYRYSEEYENKMKIEQTRRLDRMQAIASVHRTTSKIGDIFSNKRREKNGYNSNKEMEMSESPKSII
jgi:hypothetical protein